MQLFRRSMLQVIVSGAICSTLPSLAFAQTQKLASEYDVIVIGSGFAGLAAAISAAEKGAKVIVLGRLFSYHMDGPHTDTEFQSCGSHHHTEQKFVPSEGGMCFFPVFLFHICPFPDFSL